MGFFAPKPQPPPPMTVIGSKTRFEGEVASKRDIELHGRVKGKIKTEGVLKIQKGAVLEGAAACAELVAEGTLQGELDATRIVRVLPGGKISGTLAYRTLSVTPGGVVEGHLKGPKG